MVGGHPDAVELVDGAADNLVFAETDDVAGLPREVVPEVSELRALEKRFVAADALG